MTQRDESVTAAAPDELRWSILQAAIAGDRERHDHLMTEAVDVERVAAWDEMNAREAELERPRRVAMESAQEMMDAALELFLAGVDVGEIAEACGYDDSVTGREALAQHLGRHVIDSVRDAGR